MALRQRRKLPYNPRPARWWKQAENQLFCPRYQKFGREKAPLWGFLLPGEDSGQCFTAEKEWAEGPFFV